MSFRLVPRLVTLNGVTAVTLRYFTEFGKPALQKTMWPNLCKSLLHFLVRVQCGRKESSRSLSHLLMSFLYVSLDSATRYLTNGEKYLLTAEKPWDLQGFPLDHPLASGLYTVNHRKRHILFLTITLGFQTALTLKKYVVDISITKTWLVLYTNRKP